MERSVSDRTTAANFRLEKVASRFSAFALGFKDTLLDSQCGMKYRHTTR